MKKLTIGLLIISLLATFSIVGFGATASNEVTIQIPELTLIGLNNGTGGTAVTLTAGEPPAPGELPSDNANSDNTLDYLVISGSGNSYEITAKLDTAISGRNYELYVNTLNSDVPAQWEGGDGGDAGTGTSDTTISTGVNLSTTAQDFITGITSPVATGNEGATLKYRLHFDSTLGVPAYDDTGTTYTVTYTLTTTS